MDQYQEYIALSRYSKWLEDKGKRETWQETVNRYFTFFKDKFPDILEYNTINELYYAVLQLEVMPSMRCMMTAGEALDRDNVAGYNCSYVAVNRQRAFDELMYVLLCGTGVGFSCERQEIAKLPTIAEEFYESDTTIVVGDSKIGWATAFRELISLLYSGKIPKWDLSKVRPAGAPLKTFGGRASGPAPVESLFKYCINTFNRFKGQRLPTIAILDIVCKVAEVIVVGGVRRSALIALTDTTDEYAAKAKSPYPVIEYTLLGHNEDRTKREYSIRLDDTPYGERSLIVYLDDFESEQLQTKHTLNWWHIHPERALANISAVFNNKPNVIGFMQFWQDLIRSCSGERGIFNRTASKQQAAKNKRRDSEYDFGTNPCSEIILRDRQFCNLSEVVVRAGDTFEDLKRTVRIATILGTMQATLTNYRYLSKKWGENTEEEALLGVSLTGIMDHPMMSGQADKQLIEELIDTGVDPYDVRRGDGLLSDWLQQLKEVAIETNKEWSDRLGVKQSAAITCIKPSGTVSQLVNSASGIHPRYSPYYIRTVRADKKDPLAKYMVDAGFPVEDDITKPDSTYVFSFPIKSPSDSIYRNDRTAIEQLKSWLTYQRYWCEHKPSITVYVKDEEWMEVGAWVWRHFDELSGVAFLPYDGGTYKQAPYTEITKREYEELLERMPTAEWEKLSKYEDSDMTEGAQTLACTGGSCEV